MYDQLERMHTMLPFGMGNQTQRICEGSDKVRFVQMGKKPGGNACMQIFCFRSCTIRSIRKNRSDQTLERVVFDACKK